MKTNRLLCSALVAVLATVWAPPVLSQEESLIPPDETMTVNFRDQDLASVLEMFSSNYGLNLVYGPEVNGSVSINLFDAPVREALQRILSANGFYAIEEDGFLLVKPAHATGDSGEVSSVAIAFDPIILRLNHLRASTVLPMISPLLSADERAITGPETESSGLNDISSDLGGNDDAAQEMIVLMARKETQRRVRGLIANLDIPPKQVLVEATILAVRLSDNASLGVDFTALGGIDFQAMGGSTNITDSFTGADVGGDQLQDWLLGVRQTGFTDPGAKGLHLGILRNQVGVFISALEETGNATVLSNPQVLTLNRHAAQVLVGRKIGYQTTTTTQTTTTQNVEFLEVGTSLVFRPFISDDGYVRMEIHPKNSDGEINPITGLPDETTTEVSTNIIVRSGHTIVIGGLIENTVSTSVSQIPLLGSLPWIGSLFRSETQTEVRNEIIIMLTPHIIDDSELDTRAADARQRFATAQARVAASHHGYLRPSYARRMYAEAGSALADGNTELALAKAEWGLAAMPADPDLAAMAKHCADEMRSAELERLELQDAVELIEQLEKK